MDLFIFIHLNIYILATFSRYFLNNIFYNEKSDSIDKCYHRYTRLFEQSIDFKIHVYIRNNYMRLFFNVFPKSFSTVHRRPERPPSLLT